MIVLVSPWSCYHHLDDTSEVLTAQAALAALAAQVVGHVYAESPSSCQALILTFVFVNISFLITLVVFWLVIL
jgi:hypothetical protein